MTELSLDLVRGLHLLCLALGMGSALYLDFRTLRGLKSIVQDHDVLEIERIHRFVTVAFVGLWATGLVLIWVRTGFDLAKFSPKLWCKIIVVSLMTLNSVAIACLVLPFMRSQIGRCMLDQSSRVLLPLVTFASVSAFCWLAALALGSSSYLKTAPWDVLAPSFSIAAAVIIFGGVGLFFGLRTMLVRSKECPDTFETSPESPPQT